MPEFRVVKRGDIPRSRNRYPNRIPKANLSKTGNLVLSVGAVEALGSRNCGVLAEFDEQSKVLKLTAVDQPPRGLDQDDLFNLAVRGTKRMSRPLGMLYLGKLLQYIGCKVNGSRSLPITTDPGNRSISFTLPAEMFCDGFSN